MTLLESLCKYIQSAPGIPAGGVFILEDDDKKNVSILLTPTQGYREPEVPVYHQSFQVLTRSKAYPDAESIAWRAYERVESYQPTDADEKPKAFPDMVQQPTYLGIDDKKRCVFSFNFTIPTIRKQ